LQRCKKASDQNILIVCCKKALFAAPRAYIIKFELCHICSTCRSSISSRLCLLWFIIY
jgi:hypothetical protein